MFTKQSGLDPRCYKRSLQVVVNTTPTVQSQGRLAAMSRSDPAECDMGAIALSLLPTVQHFVLEHRGVKEGAVARS